MRYGYIYAITNKINGKMYIGQTRMTLNERFRKHKNVFEWGLGNNRFLYNAFAKYGLESFYIKQLCHCEAHLLNEKETYYIKKFDTFKNGYNMTLGGLNENVPKLKDEDFDRLYKLINEGYSIKSISKMINCSQRTISNFLKARNVVINRRPSKSVFYQFTKEDGHKFKCNLVRQDKKVRINELDKNFNSIKECCVFLMEHNKTTAKLKSLHESIRRCCIKDRPTYMGLHFEFI